MPGCEPPKHGLIVVIFVMTEKNERDIFTQSGSSKGEIPMRPSNRFEISAAMGNVNMQDLRGNILKIVSGINTKIILDTGCTNRIVEAVHCLRLELPPSSLAEDRDRL